MIIEIALGIVLGVLILAFLPFLLALGYWALIGSIGVGLIVAILFNFGAIGEFVSSTILIAVSLTLLAFVCVAPLAAVGFIAYHSTFVIKHLRLGSRPILGNETNKFLRYKELWLDYASAGFRVFALGLILALLGILVSILLAS